MAGYSNTPLARKLGIKPGQKIALIGRPSGWEIEELPEGVTVQDHPGRALGMQDQPGGALDMHDHPSRALDVHDHAGALDLILAFFDQRAELARDAPDLLPALRPEGSLWIAWPRRAGGHVSDIRESDLRDILLPTGVVDVKVAALDEDWSSLKFLWRKELRSKLHPPTASRATPR